MSRLFEIFSIQYLSFMIVLIIFSFVSAAMFYTRFQIPFVEEHGHYMQPADNEIEVEIVKEEIPEEIKPPELQAEDSNTPLTSLSSDINDTREKSMEDYSKYTQSKSVEESVKEREARLFEEIQADKETRNNYLKDFEEEKTYKDPEMPLENSGNVKNKAFAGRTMADYDFTDPRRYSRTGGLKIPGYTGLSGGKIVVRVEVNPIGYIQKAEIDEFQTTISDPNARSMALSYAQKERFKRVDNAPKRQVGYFIYTFVSQ